MQSSSQHLINSEHTSQHTIEMQISLERGLQVYSNPDEQEILKAVIQSGEHSALTWVACGHDEQIRIIKLLELKEMLIAKLGSGGIQRYTGQ